MNSVRKQIFFKSSFKSQYFSVTATFFKIVHAFFCLDFGFYEHKSKTRKVFWKSFTIFQAILFICLCVYVARITSPSISFFFTFILYFIHYLMNVVFLIFFCRNATFCQFFRELEYIDLKLGIINDTYNIEKKIILINMFYTLFYIGNTTIICMPSQLASAHCYDNLFFSFITIIVISFIYVHTSYMFVFLCIHCRLQTFALILKEQPINNIYPMHLIYKSIADLAEIYKSAFDPSYIATLIFTTIEVMVQLILLIKEIKYANNVSFSLSYAGLMVFMVSMFAPAIYAEKVARKANDLKIILHDKLLHEQNPGRQFELERFIRYVEARPLRFRVYRVIPLDASLLGMVLNFIVTYLIVIIQFTYKE